MKEKSLFWRKFGHLNLFRKLRPRIMMMMAVLVLPISVMCVVLAVVSAVEGSRQTHMIGNNGLGMVAREMELQCQVEGIDLLADFPEIPARMLQSLLPVVEGNSGRLYVTLGDGKTWRILPGGESEMTEESLEGLREQAAEIYDWQSSKTPLRVMVLFSSSFSFRYIPVWFWVAIGISVLTLLLCPLLYQRLAHDVLKPMAMIHAAQEQFAENRDYRIPLQDDAVSDDFLELYEGFNGMAEEVQASYDKDIKMLEAEMENLRLQVNPHMLLNSYNMIYALAQSKNYEVIQDYTLCLVDYFRYVLRRGEKMVTLRQELAFVDNFIHIQRIRFPGRFSYVYQAAEDCLEARIPPLLIENFVENAVKYALNPTEPIEIIVTARRETGSSGAEKLKIAVTDTGSGIRPEILEKLKAREPYIDEAGHKHIGVWNCLRRVELFYGERGSVHFTSGEGTGTQVFLSIPFVTEETYFVRDPR